MVFPDSYFEDEVRSGFYIDAKMKACWAAQIDILLEIDRICQKYNIQYFAEWGTLLGTIRHGGFIPWDDDMDIAMKRVDYERFLKVAPGELPEKYEILDYKREEQYWDVMARVLNADFVDCSPEFLDKYHNCPYACGVDIFPLDYVAKDRSQEATQRELIDIVKGVADSNMAGKLSPEELEAWLVMVENLSNQKIDRQGNIKNQLYKIVCALYAIYGEEESDRIALMPQYLEGGGSVYPKECYADSIRMPFDVITIPVPVGYDKILKLKYGDYMKNVRSGGGHDYPFYEKQDAVLKSHGIEFPKYKYPSNLDVRVKNPVFRQVLEQKLRLLGQIHEKIELLINYGQHEVMLNLMQELQNVAVAIGNSIEQKVGDGTEAVVCLEQYCEVVFQLFETISQNRSVDGSQIRGILDEMLSFVKQAVDALKIKKEIVFMPYRANQWKAIESVWRAACAEEDCDVKVVPIPYYYKRGLGAALSEMHYDGNDFPEYVPITSIDKYNLENNHPDKIYIQNACDEWNHILTIHSDYFSPKLWQHTEELVYIPWFKTDEMHPDDERALKVRRSYVPMPGVVHADKVIVQSEGMKESYVDYLSEWAGEETRSMWEEKILGQGSPLDDVEPELPERPAEWGDKKVMLYHISGNSLMEHKEKMLAKMEKTMEEFEVQAEKIRVIWLQDTQMQQRLAPRIPEIFAGYVEAVAKWQECPWVTVFSAEDEEKAVQLADAFYGDAGKSAQLMKQASKPVMLQNVEI